MRHCIGSYASLCAAGESHVFSLRKADGARRSTLQVMHPNATGKHYLIQEHRAFANRDPGKICMAAAAELLDLLKGLRGSGGALTQIHISY